MMRLAFFVSACLSLVLVGCSDKKIEVGKDTAAAGVKADPVAPKGDIPIPGKK